MSEVLSWDGVVKNALNMYVNRDKYAYYFDAKGCVLTDETMTYLESLHPEHFSRYTKEELKKIHDFSRGKIGYDCTGFVYAVSGVGGSANGIYEGSKVKYPNSVDNVCGTMLHKNGHAGIDIGFGYFLHIPIEGHTIELGWSRLYNWENACNLETVDYNGANNR